MSGPTRVRCIASAAGVLMTLIAGTATPVSAMEPVPGNSPIADEGRDALTWCYPFFDIRQDPRDLPTDASRASMVAWHATPAYAKAQRQADALRASIPGMAIDEHPTLGTIQFLRSPLAFLTPPSKDAPKQVVKAWVSEHSDLLQLTGADLDKARITRDFDTSDGLMQHLTWQQTINGVDLFGAELRANVTGRGELMNVGCTMLPVAGLSFPAPKLSDLEAIRAASANVGLRLSTDPVAGPAQGVDQQRTWDRAPEMGNQDKVESRLVYFARSRTNIVPAWSVVIPTPGPGNTYEMVVDATNGDILWRYNRLVWDTTQPASYRVFTSDSPAPGSPGTNTPSGFQFPIVARTLVTVQPGDISSIDPNGWILDGSNTTDGTNVRAYTDAANDNTASAADFATGTAAPARVFDFAQNLSTDAPSVYRDAAITQLFYFGNRYHDRLFNLGFNEAAGNFQKQNFSGSGVANDPVLAEAQDGSGTNNANFSTSGSDGSTGRCQMYVWTGPNPDRDGDLDGDIVYHEMSHGLSIRLHRGGLTGTQGGGMGEGWSDFFALCLNAESGDDFGAVYAAGAYATLNISSGFTNNYYFGIRRYPYSADMTKSPLTYADIDVMTVDGSIPRGPIGSATPNEVHNEGEIWCQALLEVRYFIGQTEGFAANNIAMQLAVDGMKLAPSTPNMLQERDTILQAELARYGGVHTSAIWQGFAKRGMGYSATSPTGGATAGIVEAFDTPQRVNFSYPDGLPSQILPGVGTTFHVLASPFNLTINPNSGLLHYSVNGGAYSTVAMTEGPANSYTAVIPSLSCYDTVSYYVSVGTSVGVRNDPFDAPTSFNAGSVYSSSQDVFHDDFETNRGWTVGPNTATTGIWGRMDPEPTAAQPGDDVTPGAGTQCYVTDGLAGASVGANDIDGGYTTLTSPTINVAGYSNAVVEYYRWYSNTQGAAPAADIFTVDVSNNNGSTWTRLETVGPDTQNNGGWIKASYRIADFVTPTSQMKFRFIAEDAGTGSVVEAALDEFRIYQLACTPPCITDYNQDGAADLSDVIDLANDIASGTESFPPNTSDFNGDGSSDTGDVIDLVNAIASGGC